MSRIGGKIKEARLSANLTEKQLAKKIGVAESFIKEVETGRKVINENVIEKISKVLGKDLNDIGMSFEEESFKEEVSKPKKTLEAVQDVWSDAFSSVLKTVPIYRYDLSKALGGKQMPILNNKIEGYSKDKVLFLQVENDDMIGFRIGKEDLVFGHISHEVENNSICLIENNGERFIRQIKRLDNTKLLLVSNNGILKTETVGIKEIKVLVKLERVEIKL